MLTHGIRAHDYRCEPLSQCIHDSGLEEITDSLCQSCMLEKYSIDFTKRDAMQVRGERRYRGGVGACGWTGWWECSCIGRCSREASDAVSHNRGWLNFSWVSSAYVRPCPNVDKAQ